MYKFDCGCEFPILDPTIKEDGLPSLDLDFDKLNMNCPKTWSIFLEGRTKGVFQLEKSLGQHWSKLVSPTSISEISDLISLMRPGTLGSKDESGKSMAQHYVDRKNGSEEAIPLDPTLFDILSGTQQVLLYQESILEIAKDIAGFDLKEADTLRKAVGKKDAQLLAKVRINFIEKAKEKAVVSEEMANTIFDNIWASARYSFNKSHGVAYGLITYYTAYVKCLSPLTEVNSTYGKVTLANLNINDKILAPDKDGNDTYVTVLDKIKSNQKLVRITLQSGKTIDCSLKHKFLCDDGEIRPLEQILEKNHKIMTRNN